MSLQDGPRSGQMAKTRSPSGLGLEMINEFSRTAVATIALMRIKGVGRRAALKLVGEGLMTDDDELALLERAARHRIDPEAVKSGWGFAEDQLSKSRAANVLAFAYSDDGYPARLRNIPDPPALLFVKGERDGLYLDNTVAVVGTREPTDYGERVAARSAASAVGMGFGIVSGLAHGCDTYAHEGCVEANGIGVAVLAHGLDKVYPAANKGLAKRLLDLGGCLVSEYPIGMAPLRTAFAERDRIQSGLADGLLVIETDVKGGTMHTVNFSRQQKRPLACIYHPEAWQDEPKVQGNRRMIDDRWAEPIANGDALISFLQRLTRRPNANAAPPRNTSAQRTMDF
ncbi:DNA-processing protein DprA (plasmid) [Rhizobium ruizarguesonis]|nr:DNA-processing protein DprA [Rhizobium ruizarguesonis]